MATAIGTYATTALAKEAMGISNSTDDTLIGKLVDRVNGWIEYRTGRVIAPISSTTYYFDGNGTNRLSVTAGVRAITALTVAPSTGATPVAATAGDIFIRPLIQERLTGWPGEEIWLSDRPTGSVSIFSKGFSTVAVTATFGWAVIPDEITSIALTCVAAAWARRKEGNVDVITIGEDGDRTFIAYLSREERRTLEIYTAHPR
jgi:hypothetical protein